MLFLPGGIAVSYSAVPLMLASFSDPLDMPLCSNLCLWLSQSFAGHSASPKIVICYLKTAELEFKFCPNSNSLLAIIPFPFINFYQVTRQHWGSTATRGWTQPFRNTSESHPRLWLVSPTELWTHPERQDPFTRWRKCCNSTHLIFLLFSSQWVFVITQEHIMKSPKFWQSSCWVWCLGS